MLLHSRLSFLTLAFLSVVFRVSGFVEQHYRTRIRALPSALNAEDSPNSVETETDASLHICADVHLTSKKLSCDNIEMVSQFLMRPETRNMIVSAGGTRPFEVLHLNSELEDIWNDSCDQYYSSEENPVKSDVLLAVETSMKFPGVTLTTKTLSGVKQVVGDGKTLPCYNFLVVGEEQIIEGLAPAVWLFRQLTGNKSEREGYGPSSARVKTCVSIVEEEEGGYAFDLDCKFQINMKFPSLLMKMLPSTEKVEKQVGEGIQKTIRADIEKSLLAMEKALTENVAECVHQV